jgi:glycosyltransferase involved in cell wall biosynthesis
MDKNLAPKISAVVMIYNEEAQIRDCLKTIAWVDEIVICDSFSTDKTLEICREFTDKIFQRKFDNFGNQKRWTLGPPSHEWVIFFEADERLPRELAEEIRSRLSRDEGYDGYWIPYKSFNFGKEMKGTYWSAKRIKLYKKEKGDWERKLVHDNFILHGKAGELVNPVLHYPYPNLKVLFIKFNRYTSLEAKQLISSKARINAINTIKALAWIPLRFYIYFFKWEDYKSGLAGIPYALIMSFYAIVINIKYWVLRLQGYKGERIIRNG